MVLRAHEEDWIDALRALHRRVKATLDRVAREVNGPERSLVLADFEAERDRIETTLAELTGSGSQAPVTAAPAADDPADDDPEPLITEPQLQLTWDEGRVLAWAASSGAGPEPTQAVIERLRAGGAAVGGWEPDEPVALPGGSSAPAVAAPIQASLGWLVSLATSDHEEHGVSVRWMGLAAALAVRLVGQGRMVPQLTKTGDAPGNRSYFAVRWEPTLIDHDELAGLARSMPGTVAARNPRRDAHAITRAVVAGFVDAICRDAAGRIEVPAPPPQPHRVAEVAETVLARLDGSSFEAPHQQGSEIRRGLKSWAEGVTGASKLALIVKLDPPDEGDAWLLRTLASDGRRKDEPVEAAMSRANHERKEAIKRELERLEGLYPPLRRGKDTRRGQVILSQDEAWELMSSTGSVLVAAGFEVRVPPMSPRKATPSLKLTSTGVEGEPVVGARQLTSVRWSAVFDGVELTAQDIARLSAESRPLVRSEGRWVEVDHADLAAAAAALEERASRTRLSGAEMLRHALGLDGMALGSPVAVAGEGWAAELLASAQAIPEHPPTRPEGFEGELRSYQADALAWLGFLDSAALGGCLALDMGLGKTPTVLAHLQRTTERGPALVIAPPAVVGNWAAEAARFVPGLRVMIHHGARRADTADIAGEVAACDVLVTTFGTAVRDIGALEEVAWGTVVLDEGQVIKNPTSDTAQQLRRLDGHLRLVLTGTPIENGLGDLWALMDFVNPGLVGDRATFIAQMQQASERGRTAESALRMLNGVLVFRRTKAEPVIAAELPDRIDALDHCPMTPEQIGLYQAVLDELVLASSSSSNGQPNGEPRKAQVLAAITALKQICNHPAAYTRDEGALEGRSGKLARLEEIVDNVFEAGERMLIFTHFATWGERLATHLTARTGRPIACYHGGLSRGARDRMVEEFQAQQGPGALVLSLKAGGTGLNLTAASHVVLYDRWWNPAVEDQARDRAWRIGQTRTVVAHRLVCPGTVDERVEEVVAGKRRIADLALPRSSSVGDLDAEQLRKALGLDPSLLLADDNPVPSIPGGDR